TYFFFLILLRLPRSTLFPYTTLFRSVANESMFEFWGKTREEVLHKPLFEAIPEAKDQGYEELMTRVLETGQDFAATEQPVILPRSEEQTSELQSQSNLVCRLLLEKKK